MRKLIFLFILIVIVYSVYHDLSVGSLPGMIATSSGSENIESQNKDIKNYVKPYKKVIIERGQTVLSIVEQLHEGPIPVSIQEVIYDFKQLNDGIEPENIQVGDIYLFPLY